MTSPVFLTGSTLRHVLVMTGASTVGLVAMFAVDVVDLYFLTLLGDQAIIAAVGFAAGLLYFTMSIGIGLQIALGALVARSLGTGDKEQAGRYFSSSLILNSAVAMLLAGLVWWQLPALLMLLGASGDALDYAVRYTRIQLPAIPLVILGMSFGAGLRAVGDARRFMFVSLAGAVANAVLDPIFIFTLGWGLEGASWASVVARFVVFALTGYILFYRHRLPRAVTFSQVMDSAPAILAIGLPAVMTSLATPLGNSLILRLISDFGDGAVAAYAVLARIVPVAFAAVFAVSGAVGPIVGQNAGACRYDRVHSTLISASAFIIGYTAVAWLLLWLSLPWITQYFATTDYAAQLIEFYVTFLVGAFALNGLLFVANASFNNLGRALLATLFNYGKVLLGMVPLAYLLAGPYGPHGVMLGEAAGMSIFGVLGIVSALLLVKSLRRHYPIPQAAPASVTR